MLSPGWSVNTMTPKELCWQNSLKEQTDKQVTAKIKPWGIMPACFLTGFKLVQPSSKLVQPVWSWFGDGQVSTKVIEKATLLWLSLVQAAGHHQIPDGIQELLLAGLHLEFPAGTLGCRRDTKYTESRFFHTGIVPKLIQHSPAWSGLNKNLRGRHYFGYYS